MTGNYYKTGFYKPDSSTYGGRVYASDFETDFRGNDNQGSPIAQRIISDWNFDIRCKKNIEQRNRKKVLANG